MSTAVLTRDAERATGRVAPLQVPVQLPRRRYGPGHRLDVLSVTSVRAFETCPEAFRRRYLLGEREPTNLLMLMGSVVGDSLAHFFQHQIDNEPLARSEVDDLAISIFDQKIAGTVLGDGDDPVAAKAQCRSGVDSYLEELAPRIQPISVERRASFRLAEEQEWRFVCFFDLECEDEIPDLKFGEERVSEARVLKDLQATAYAYCRWAEGTPAGFVFHSGLSKVTAGEPRWLAVPASRSVAHFLGFEQRVARAARQIVHLDETEPGEWPLSSEWGGWCAPREGTKGCPYWDRCPVSGNPDSFI